MTDELPRPDQRAALRRWATRSITRQDRLVLLLRYYESMTFSEIAVTLALPEPEVRHIHSTLLSRAKTLLDGLDGSRP